MYTSIISLQKINIFDSKTYFKRRTIREIMDGAMSELISR